MANEVSIWNKVMSSAMTVPGVKVDRESFLRKEFSLYCSAEQLDKVISIRHIMPAQVRKPKQKASVEGTVGKIATVIIASLRNREFNSFEELYKAVRERLEVFNSTPFQKRDGSRKEVFEEVEKKTLRPLPEFPFEVCHWFYSRKVQLNCHIAYKKNWYSVPYEYVGKMVDIKVTETTLNSKS